MLHLEESLKVKIVLGTALFGSAADPQAKFNTPAAAKIVLDIYRERGYNEIDTARAYPVGAPGTCEQLLGQIDDGNWMKLGSKIKSYAPGSHQAGKIAASVQSSLEALKIPQVNFSLQF
jgi:aflatoxin B1 aldehyde reductase